MIYEEMQKQQIKMLENDNRLLAQEIEDYRERINKAIQRIEQELNYTPSSNRKEVGLILVDYKKILDILKGEEK